MLILALMTMVSAQAQMEFSFSGLSGVKQAQLTDGTTLVQLPAGTSLSSMSSYGMSVTVDGTAATLTDIVPNPSTQSYTDGALVAFYYKGKSYQVRFSSGEYFTAVFFSDAKTGSTSGVSAANLATYAENITKMGKAGGQHFQFDALPGYNPTADIAFYLGDMTSGNSATPIIHTVSNYSNVTRICAVVFGQFESMGTNSAVTEYGLCYSTAANPTTSNTYKAAADYAEADDVFGEDLVGVFGVYFDGLTPQTTYHVRAYCKYTQNGTSYTTYGEDITITTTGGSGFTWAWEGGETPDATVKARITEAMDSAKYYYHNYCNLYKWCGTSYNSGVQTADCSLRSDQSCYIRFGPGERYQWVGTAQHEISHGYGIGQTSAFSGYPKPFQFKVGTLTLRVFMRDMSMTITHDAMHYWPGGINQREEVTNGTTNNKGTYTCKNEEMLKCNALILNGFAKDGMRTTYGVKEENGDLDWGDMDAVPQQTRRKVTAASGGTSFEVALDAFRSAGIPLIVSSGESDQAHGTTGADATGYALNQNTYAAVTRSLTEAQNFGVGNVNRFSATTLNNTVDPQPYTFTFKGVRFYNGLKFWFDKAMYKYSNTSYRYLTPDQTLANLTTFVNSHATETSIWMQHYPMSAEDYIWLDKQTNSDAAGTVYRYNNGTTAYNNNAYNATYNQYNTAALRRSKLANLINSTANAAMFSGHSGTYNTNSANTFTDYTVDGIGNTPGDVLIVLMKAGKGVIEVKRVDFRTYDPIVSVTEDNVADKSPSAQNQNNVVLGGLVEALESLNTGNSSITTAITTAKNAKTATAVTSSISSLSTAFANYAGSEVVDVTGLLGENTDFETAQGARISELIGDATQGLFAIPGWKENHYAIQTAWAFCQYKNDQGSPASGNSLYLRENWKGSPAQPSIIQVTKDAVLPAGKFRLTFYMRQASSNYTESLNYYEINGVRTAISAGNTWESKSINIELDQASIFRLSFGFKGTIREGNVPSQVDIDNVKLHWIGEEQSSSLDGTYYLYNPSTGLFLTGANDWGTQASLAETGIDFVLASNGMGYTLDSQVSNGGTAHYLGSNLYIDGGAVAWTFAETGTGDNGKKTYTISIDGTNFLTAPSTGKIITTTSSNNAAGAQWQLLTKLDLVNNMSKATEANPVNATFLLPGFNFSRNDTRNTQWTNNGDWTDHGGNVSNLVVEYWNRNFDIYQQLSNIPNGIYELSCQGYYRNGGKDVTSGQAINAYLYANTTTQSLPDILSGAGQNGTVGYQNANGYIPNSIGDASSYLSAGLYWSKPIRITVENGILKVGAKKETTVADDWTVIDNFRLMYLGDGSALKIGDVDDDGDVDFDDVTALANYLTSKPGHYNLDVADVNEDGHIGIGDITALVSNLLQGN